MKTKLVFLSAVILIILINIQELFAGAVTSSEEISINTTGGGIKVKSDNGNSFSVIGLIQYDYKDYDGLYNSNNDGSSSSESEWRRTELGVEGGVGHDWEYKFVAEIEDKEEAAASKKI